MSVLLFGFHTDDLAVGCVSLLFSNLLEGSDFEIICLLGFKLFDYGFLSCCCLHLLKALVHLHGTIDFIRVSLAEFLPGYLRLFALLCFGFDILI